MGAERGAARVRHAAALLAELTEGGRFVIGLQDTYARVPAEHVARQRRPSCLVHTMGGMPGEHMLRTLRSLACDVLARLKCQLKALIEERTCG